MIGIDDLIRPVEQFITQLFSKGYLTIIMIALVIGLIYLVLK